MFDRIERHDTAALGLGLAIVDCCEGLRERDEAVKILLAMAISALQRRKNMSAFCGQGPSDHPDWRLAARHRELRACRSTRIPLVETWMFLAQQKVPETISSRNLCRVVTGERVGVAATFLPVSPLLHPYAGETADALSCRVGIFPPHTTVSLPRYHRIHHRPDVTQFCRS